MSSDTVARFQAKVDTAAGPTACWPFTAFVGDTGYGQFWDGVRLVKAHRFAYALKTGAQASGEVDHVCHNASGCAGGASCKHRRCCNPAHLEDVTHQVNVARGEAGHQSRPLATVCIHGHEYTPENTYLDPKGHQRCRTCAAIRYQSRKAAA